MRLHLPGPFEPALARLRSLTNAQQRGREFEDLLAQMFAAEHFDVRRKALSANKRQVDLFASLGTLNLLIEAKWLKKPADVDHVDRLRARLESAPPHVVGTLVSMSGFTRGAVARVAEKSERPIVLLTGREIETCARDLQRLHPLIGRKLQHLARYQRVMLDESPESSEVWRTDLPEASIAIVDLDGGTQPTWESRPGGYDPLVFVLHLADTDWILSGGVGASIDLDLVIDDQSQLIRVVRLLHQLGWLTPEASWRVNQSVAAWNGFGAACLVEQLEDWVGRYGTRRMHHTEQLIYTDVCDNGLFTLTADVAVHSGRRVSHARLSFQLSGIPLDTSAFETLAAAFPVSGPPYFRPRVDPAVKTKPLPRAKRPVQPRAFLVRNHDGSDGEMERWVEGLVVDDPYVRLGRGGRVKAELPAESLGQVITWLRSSHPLGEQRTYETYRAESTWTSDAEVLRFMSDWAD